MQRTNACSGISNKTFTFDTLSSFRDILQVNLDPTSDICRTNCFNTQVYIRHLRYTTYLNNKSQIVLRFDPAVKVTESISDYDECDLTVWIGSCPWSLAWFIDQ